MTLPPPVRGGDPDLSAICQALRQWRSSFVNIHLTYEMRNPEQVKAYRKEAVGKPLDSFYHRHRWVWAAYGAVREDSWSLADGRCESYQAQGSNARTTTLFGATYKAQGKGELFMTRLLTMPMSTPQPTSAWLVLPLRGLYYGGKWLDELLGESHGSLEKYDDIDGFRCARVKWTQGPYEETLWLDPAHQFLVRKIHAPEKDVQGSRDFTVQEYQRLESGIWFPKRGTDRVGNDPPSETARWVVTHVAVNQALDEKLFDPPAPQVGTHVTDGRSGRVYLHGASAGQHAIESKMAVEAKENAQSSAAGVSAAVPGYRGLVWSGALLAASAVLIGLAIWLRSRSARPVRG